MRPRAVTENEWSQSQRAGADAGTQGTQLMSTIWVQKSEAQGVQQAQKYLRLGLTLSTLMGDTSVLEALLRA